MTSQLIIYNWTPWKTYVQLNGIQNIPGCPILPSTQNYSYFPYSTKLLRDLSYDHGESNIWGKTNKLTIRWEEVSDSLNFTNIRDPATALPGVDVLLWVMPDRVLISQQSVMQEEIYPDS
jgi:hypothetical protein